MSADDPEAVAASSLPPDYLSEAAAAPDDACHRRYHLGEWVAAEGQIRSLPDGQVRSPEGRTFRRVVAGIDWGVVHAFACEVVGQTGSGRLAVVGELYTRGQTVDELVPALKALQERWAIETFHAGPSFVAAAGLGRNRLVSLEVRGRRSGRLLSFPLIVADYRDERFLVAMLGEGTGWVSNVRAAGGEAVLRHGRREPVVLQEVDPANRAPILKRHLQVAPAARSFVPVDRRAPIAEFERVAASLPVFRIEPIPA